MQKNYYVFIDDIIPKNFLALIKPQHINFVVSHSKPTNIISYLKTNNVDFDFMHLQQESTILPAISEYTKITRNFRNWFCKNIRKQYRKFWWLTGPSFMHVSKDAYKFILINEFINKVKNFDSNKNTHFWIFAPHNSKYIIKTDKHTILMTTNNATKNFKKISKNIIGITFQFINALLSIFKHKHRNININTDITFVCWGWWVKNYNNIIVDQYYGELPIYLSKKFKTSLIAFHDLSVPLFIERNKVNVDSIVPRLFFSNLKAMVPFIYFMIKTVIMSSFVFLPLKRSDTTKNIKKLQLVDLLLNLSAFYGYIESYYDWISFFQKNKTRALFFYDKVYPKGRALTLAVKALASDTKPLLFGISHGAVTIHIPTYYGDNGDKENPFPVQDVIFVNDKYAKEAHDWMAHYTPGCDVVISGFHTISEKCVNKYAINEFNSNRPIILLIAADWNSTKDVWFKIVELSNEIDIQLIFRPHPGWLPPKEEIHKFGRDNKNSKLLYDETLDIDRQIAAADWILAFESTVLFNCLKYNKTTFIMSFDEKFEEYRFRERFKQFKNIKYITDITELEKIVCYIARTKPEPSNNDLSQIPYHFGSDSMDIIAKTVTELSRK
jgi:hypothetical protein